MIYVIFIFFILAILCFSFYQFQYFMIFTPLYYRKDEKLSEEFTPLEIHTEDGIKLEGVVYEPKKFHATLLFFAGRSQDSVGVIKKLADNYKGFRIVTFNYRSYGKSEGKINEEFLYSDASLIAKLVQKNYGDFYLLGFSLGSVVAANIAQTHKTLGIYLIGSFDSLQGLAKEKYGLNLKWCLRYKFNVEDFVKNIEVPVSLFLSKSDATTYIQNGRNLKKSIVNLDNYIELEETQHQDLLFAPEIVKKIVG